MDTLGQIYVSKVTIPANSVDQLAATPYELVPAPGANKLLVFHGITIYLDYTIPAYTEAGDNLIVVCDVLGASIVVSDVIEMTGFITLTSDSITRGVPVTDTIGASANMLNKNLTLFNNNAEFGNNGGSDLHVHTYYSIIDYNGIV